jgi:TonB family protein
MRARSRSSISTLISAAVHGVLGLALIAIARPGAPQLPHHDAPLVFVKMAPPPVFLDLPPAAPAAASKPALEIPRAPAPPPAPAPAPEPIARVAPKPRVEPPPSPSPAKVDAPKPAPPPVTVGLFSDPAAPAHAIEAPKRVEAAGFDTPVAAATAPARNAIASALGAFDQPLEAASRPRTTGVVAASGFGDAQPRDARTAKQTPAVVRASGFDDTREAPALAQRAPKVEPDEPVEITFKPAPVYTEEARSLKLEGDVVLDVEFEASGRVRVIGLARGLGHGLDEAAVRAASSMRFTPAKSGGRPVDFRTTVHIVFRLA